ncbi:hypothetical protein R50912_07755 [Paenibacillus sp. FSL R5-0912]|nr:hypothetical protein R50912_07755 [Paenibacillus sp. FSL R5-0912]
MKRLRWRIFIYSMLFVVVLFLALNDYSPILIVGVTVVAGLIAFITLLSNLSTDELLLLFYRTQSEINNHLLSEIPSLSG